MRLAVFALCSFAVSTLGCGSSVGRTCSAESACGAGTACVIGRCRPADVAPIAEETRRVVLEPVDLAVVSSRDGSGARPEAMAFGRGASGTVELLLRFEATWREDAEVTSAFVVLEPLEGARAAATPARVDLARILEPWSSVDVSWGRQPRLEAVDDATTLRPAGKRAARFDVTRIVRGWSTRRADDHGIALVADGADAFGAVFALGPSGGLGPRLEAYVRVPTTEKP